MARCYRCGNKLPIQDQYIECPFCNAPFPTFKFKHYHCKTCGLLVENNDKICNKCGTLHPKQKSKISIIIFLLLLLVITIIVVLCFLPNTKNIMLDYLDTILVNIDDYLENLFNIF